jgi:hypothetical protein
VAHSLDKIAEAAGKGAVSRGELTEQTPFNRRLNSSGLPFPIADIESRSGSLIREVFWNANEWMGCGSFSGSFRQGQVRKIDYRLGELIRVPLERIVTGVGRWEAFFAS